jgi:hypothetical protein
VRLLIAALLLAACNKENRAELDRAEREDRARAATPRPGPVDEPAATVHARPEAEPAPALPTGLAPGAQLFVTLMAESTPREFCQEQAFFRQCFSVTEAECRTRIRAEFAKCARAHAAEMPAHPDAENGRTAGEVLGRCTGAAYEIGLAAQGRRSMRAECNDIDRWR